MPSAILKRSTVAAALAAVPLATAVVSAPPASAACTTNVYRVTQNTGLFDNGSLRWLRDKHTGDAVVGPSSNVMDNLYGNDWRVVYKGGGGFGLIYRYNLDYQYCT